MYYFSKMNFSIDSKLFKELRNKNYTMYGIETGIDYDKYYNLLFFEILVYTSEFDKVKDMIMDTLKRVDCDKEKFEMMKNNIIIAFINKSEQNSFKNISWLDNYIMYDLDYLDNLEELKVENVEDMKRMIGELDFSNYLVVKRVKKEENV